MLTKNEKQEEINYQINNYISTVYTNDITPNF